jgi:hypothetical protein
MSETNWINLLIQIPIVGVFIWYSLVIQKAFMEALDRRDQAFEKRNAAVIEAIQELNKSICGKLERTRRNAPARSSEK